MKRFTVAELSKKLQEIAAMKTNDIVQPADWQVLLDFDYPNADRVVCDVIMSDGVVRLSTEDY
jgi:hypothetical protein